MPTLSHAQLDSAERGFSFQRDGPLDMRMGPGAVRSAEEVVNTWSQDALAHMLLTYGELQVCQRLAAKIVQARAQPEALPMHCHSSASLVDKGSRAV